MSWMVYILKCSDTSLYTGITVDLERRLDEHSKGKGAKYTKLCGPFTVVFTVTQGEKKSSGTREYPIGAMERLFPQYWE
ncbi:MAG TPA: endonuclease [Nitrospiraceae bacterium]|nr:endonuclease [Nitrospiraceae bacterium]